MVDQTDHDDEAELLEEPAEPDAIQRLNQTFFQTSPGAYLRERAYALMTERRDPPTLSEEAAPASRATHQRVAARLGAVAEDIDHLADTAMPAERGDTTHALAAFILAHHANESLVRNVLAFSDSSAGDSPWLHLSGRSSSRKALQFLPRVRELLSLSREEFDTRIKKFAFGAPEILQAAIASGGDTEARLDHVKRWVRHCARAVLLNANAYNAAKHGLASTSSFSRISLVVHAPPTEDESQGSTLLHEESYIAGPTIETLETRKDEDKNQVWRRVDRVVDPIAEITSTLVVAEMLDASWEVGRCLYLQKAPIAISYLVGPTPEEVASSETVTPGVLDSPLWVPPLSRAASQDVLKRLAPRPGDANTNPEPSTGSEGSRPST